MKKILLLVSLMVAASVFGATGWYQDYVIINKNNSGSQYYWIGSDPSYGTQLDSYNFGTVTSLVITGADMKYWSDNQDRTGGAFYYKIMSADGNTQIVAPTEVIWTHSSIGGNNYQGTWTGSINLLSSLSGSTTYQLHVWAKSWGSLQGDSWLSNSGNNYVATFTTDAEVPVELTSFTAKSLGRNVVLHWATATEVRNTGYDVERSTNKINWTKIGYVEGQGNSNTPNEYSFTDKNLKVGKYFYRLKQIDTDGSFEYYYTSEVDVKTTEKFELTQNFPNPFNPSTNIAYTITQAGNVKLTLYNALGQAVKTLVNEYKEAGSYNFILVTDGLNSGVYFYKIESGNYSQVRKMMILR